MTLACTVCGSPDVIAVKPGSDGDDFADLFAVERPTPDVAWCKSCWMKKHGGCKDAQQS